MKLGYRESVKRSPRAIAGQGMRTEPHLGSNLHLAGERGRKIGSAGRRCRGVRRRVKAHDGRLLARPASREVDGIS